MMMTDDEVRNLKLDGWPLPDDYLRELGRVAALWTHLESLLNICIGKLAGFELNDSKWFIFVAHSSFPQRLDIFGALCEQLLPKFAELKDYKDVVGLLKSAQTARNRLLHHGMAIDANSGIGQTAVGSARGALKVEVENVDVASIRRGAIAVYEGTAALYKLVLKRRITPPWEAL